MQPGNKTVPSVKGREVEGRLEWEAEARAGYRMTCWETAHEHGWKGVQLESENIRFVF